MDNYEKYGSITISPTAITDKEQTYDLHQRTEGGGSTSNASDDVLEIVVNFLDDAPVSIEPIKKSTLDELFKDGKTADIRVKYICEGSDKDEEPYPWSYIGYPLIVRHGNYDDDGFGVYSFFFSIFGPGASANRIYNIKTTSDDETDEYYVYSNHSEIKLT